MPHGVETEVMRRIDGASDVGEQVGWPGLVEVVTLRPVVRHEDDHRVIQLAANAQMFEKPTGMPVNLVDHCGVDFHGPRLDLLLLIR